MPRTDVLFYREKDGTVPVIDWLDGLNQSIRAKCFAKLRRLVELGYELRRPEADFLRDGIYELRIGLRGINYRILYFYHGRNVAIVSHGIAKEDRVPPQEIERAIVRMLRFMTDPPAHSHREL